MPPYSVQLTHIIQKDSASQFVDDRLERSELRRRRFPHARIGPGLGASQRLTDFTAAAMKNPRNGPDAHAMAIRWKYSAVIFHRQHPRLLSLLSRNETSFYGGRWGGSHSLADFSRRGGSVLHAYLQSPISFHHLARSDWQPILRVSHVGTRSAANRCGGKPR